MAPFRVAALALFQTSNASLLNLMHEEIQNLARIVDGSPRPMTSPSNNNDPFIETPMVAGRWSCAAQISSGRCAKLQKPASNGLAGNIQAPLRKSLWIIFSVNHMRVPESPSPLPFHVGIPPRPPSP